MDMLLYPITHQLEQFTWGSKSRVAMYSWRKIIGPQFINIWNEFSEKMGLVESIRIQITWICNPKFLVCFHLRKLYWGCKPCLISALRFCPCNDNNNLVFAIIWGAMIIDTDIYHMTKLCLSLESFQKLPSSHS